MQLKLITTGMMVVLIVIAARNGLGALVPDGTIDNHFSGSRLDAPPGTREKVFLATNKQANFTQFAGVKDVAVTGSVLTFTMTGKKATVGWGNYLGKQPLAEIVDMWDIRNDVVLRVRQSATNSVWTMRFWVNGARNKGVAKEQALKGTDWLDFKLPGAANQIPASDGLEFEIQGEPGTRFEIECLKLTQPYGAQYFRKEFVLPEGKIWRAVADVVGQTKMMIYPNIPVENRLFVNGREVERRGPVSARRQMAPVDLSGYLRAGGTNTLGFFASAIGDRPVPSYLQLTVVMESGEVIRVVTDDTWKTSDQELEGWNRTGFNDADWAPARILKGPPWNDNKQPYKADWDETSLGEYSLAAYAGRMVIVNPDGPTLYYTAGKPIRLDIHVPPGLADKNPVIQYEFARADDEGISLPRLEGQVTKGEKKDGALVFPVRIKPQSEAGVWTIALAMLLDGKQAETREREPLIVMDITPAPVIAGKTAREGLDMELEDTIDFTDPGDPHPWFESALPLHVARDPWERITEARIVSTNGMKYREVASGRGSSFFSYRLGKLKHPGDFYLFEVEYPDNAERDFHVCIVSKVEGGGQPNVQSGTGVGTGGKAMLTHAMQTYQWVMVADSGVYSVDVINQYGMGKTKGSPAAARSVKVYHVKSKLPGIGAGAGRRFGVDNERCSFISGHGMNFGVDEPRPASVKERELAYSARQRQVKNLAWMERTARAYTEYLAYAGQNTHLIGCYQYSEMNTPYTPADEVPSSRVLPCLKNVLAHYMDARGMTFMARVIFISFEQLSTATLGNNAQVTRGRDTIYMMDAEGRQRGQSGGSTGLTPPNMMHPDIRERFSRFIGDFGRTFGHLKGFKGIYFWLDPKAYAPPAFVAGEKNFWKPDYNGGYLDYTYDDYSFAAFQKFAGINPPIDGKDSTRFKKRRELIKDDALLAKYIEWRYRGYVQGLAELGLGALRKMRPDLVFLCPWGHDPGMYKAWTQSGLLFRDYARRLGFDPESFNAVDGLSQGSVSYSWSPYYFMDGKNLYHRNPYAWIPRIEKEVTDVFSKGQIRFMQMFNNQSEGMHDSPGLDPSKIQGWGCKLVEGDWILDRYKTRSNAQMGGVWAREPFIQALIASDVNQLYFGWSDVNLPIGHEHELRAFARVFTHLPVERFETDLNTGFESNLVIRHLSKGKETFCYVANPGYWTIKGRIRVETDGAITDLVSGAPIEAKREGQTAILPVELEGYGLTAFRVSSGNWKAMGFETDPIGAAERGYIEGILTEVRGYISDPAIGSAMNKDDMAYLETTMADAEAALTKGDVARAWKRVTHWRFWALWQDYLKSASGETAPLPADLPVCAAETVQGKPEVAVTKAEKEPVIDGRLNEDMWRALPFTTGFVDTDGRAAMAATAVRLTHDDKMLYIGLVCADPDTSRVRAAAAAAQDLRASNAGDDAIYIHIQPDENVKVHYMIAFNSAGIRNERRVDGNARDYKWRSNVKIGVDKQERFWSAEVALPITDVLPEGVSSASRWRAQIVRYYRENRLLPSSLGRIGGHWYGPDPVDFFRLNWQ